jgi:phospho-N-acetylmuramoyl-pentapeptide-transferase
VPFTVFFGQTAGQSLFALCLAAIGALIPFLALNAPPAKLFMGDVGALGLGAIVGVCFASSPWRTDVWPWIAYVILILELVLVPVQIASVKLTRKRIFPATPIHHGFEKIGWPESRVLWTFLLAQAIVSVAALSEVLS